MPLRTDEGVPIASIIRVSSSARTSSARRGRRSRRAGGACGSSCTPSAGGRLGGRRLGEPGPGGGGPNGDLGLDLQGAQGGLRALEAERALDEQLAGAERLEDGRLPGGGARRRRRLLQVERVVVIGGAREEDAHRDGALRIFPSSNET